MGSRTTCFTQTQGKQALARRARVGWTADQIADRLALKEIRERRNWWRRYRDPRARDAALARFHEYAYPWY